MSDLTEPKTRLEYYLAVACGAVPGEDIPSMYDGVENVYHKYEETVEFDSEDEGVYSYMAEIENFIEPDPITILGNASVKINGYDAELDGQSWTYDDANGTFYRVALDGGDWYVGIASPTQLSGDALNVIVEFSWTEDTPIQPKTNIEHYIAALAGLYEGDLPEPKTAKEYFIKTFVENNDNTDSVDWGEPINPSDGGRIEN